MPVECESIEKFSHLDLVKKLLQLEQKNFIIYAYLRITFILYLKSKFCQLIHFLQV